MQVTVNVQIFGENILNICVINFEVNTKIQHTCPINSKDKC